MLTGLEPQNLEPNKPPLPPRLECQEHPRFQRRGADLYMKMEISLAEVQKNHDGYGFGPKVMVFCWEGSDIPVPSQHFESMIFPTSPGGICVRSLQGTGMIIPVSKWLITMVSQSSK